MSTASGTGLGATLRTWRDRLPPSAAALPVGPARRATGLRREELADLAGVSVDYVVRLEQGRATAPSAPVVASLARALQLSPAERDHLYRLARLLPPGDGAVGDTIPPGVRRVLDRLGDAAVAVFAADWRLIRWNPCWAGLLGDPSAVPSGLRNFARDRFPVDAASPRLARWPVTESDPGAVDAAVVSDLRRATGRFPRDPRLSALIDELAAGNAHFAAPWAAGTVAAHREDDKTVHHPAAGPLTVNCDVLTEGDTELKVVIMTAAPGDEARLRQVSATAAATASTADPSRAEP
ncbi:Helix-turn-helix domain-containing protein [Actinacidiphila alni]|uniref:Helix-turn-helix domain-containing protein n=1 Tax=Actinacidiphila alni TaxID=380248 RepID=A0A1I2BYR2_9ACTN|nr:helix-turn-helix transcriptional regulator [Actinacidiphila alni]SFE60420.1 Helix-turn-helix domain-containing protein [Actinacidiphila alni]